MKEGLTHNMTKNGFLLVNDCRYSQQVDHSLVVPDKVAVDRDSPSAVRDTWVVGSGRAVFGLDRVVAGQGTKEVQG